MRLLSVVWFDCQTYPALSNTDPKGNGSYATEAFLEKRNKVCVLHSETLKVYKGNGSKFGGI